MAAQPAAKTLTRAAAGARTGPARLILALACASQFMVILDASIINVALPAIQRDLGFSSAGLAWVVNGYLLAFAGFMLLGGRAADLLGHRPVLAAGLALFSASSLAAGLAPDPAVLVAARLAEGTGAALLAPATLAVLSTAFPGPRERARAFGAWSAAGGVGGMAGAIAGGALTTGLSWRWVFLINVPIGIVLIGVALRLPVLMSPALMSPARSRPGRRAPLDITGAITGTAGLGALIYGVMQGASHGWAAAPVLGPAGAGLLALAAFVAVEGRVAAAPLLPLRLLHLRTVAAGAGLLLLFGGIAIAMWYFTSLFLQNVLGYSALRAGLALTPAAVAFVLVARLTAAALPRAGVRPLVLAGCACFLAGFGWLARAGAGSGYPASVLGPTLLIAAGIGLVFPALMAGATAGVPEADAGIAGGLASTAVQAGSSVGLAALVTAASARTRLAAGDHVTAATLASGHGPAAAVASGYDLVFLIAAGLGLAIAAVSLLLPRHRPG